MELGSSKQDMIGEWDDGQKLKWKGQTVYKKTSFPHKDKQVLDQVAQNILLTPFLGVFKIPLDKALNNLVWPNR